MKRILEDKSLTKQIYADNPLTKRILEDSFPDFPFREWVAESRREFLYAYWAYTH